MRALAGTLTMFLLVAPGVHAQSAATLTTLKGLAPISALGASPAGQAALAANYQVTGAIQTGSAPQTTPLPRAEQQQQALHDAFITAANGSELADGLGSRLGAAYQARANYTDKHSYTSISPNVAALFAHTGAVTAANSNAGKYFFANGTTDGSTPVGPQAMAIMQAAGGVTDIFGRAYHLQAGSPGADPYGDSRPFQTEPSLTRIDGPDFFGRPSNNIAYLSGPEQNLIDSPAYPSGHTTYGYTDSLLLAIMVPQRYAQQIVRAAEYGNNRIVLGAHYAMDVLGGRTLALHDVAQLLAGNPDYVGLSLHGMAPITDYRAALQAARADLIAALQAECGATIDVCAAQDTGRFHDVARNDAFYDSTQTYGLPVVHTNTAGVVEDVARIAPEAGYLLLAAFPALTLPQADVILTETEGAGGGFLDDGSAFGLYSRINLYAAAKRAAAVAPQN